ncbi:MAG TPA: zinc dependent phospholipase C family protein [Thermoclostridium sp.]
MPFHMTHLHIAKNICSHLPESIKDLPQFYLGNIAPDAVHNRADYKSDYKKTSHLCVGDAPWGRCTNNDEWIENVLAFLNANRNTDDNSFLLGYCCHILSDIYNNIAVWTPFRLKYPDELEKGYGGMYHKECRKVDIELALREENRDDFWVHLEKAKSVNFNDIIFAEELEKLKENILYNWYRDKGHQDLSANKLVTLESTMSFVEEATGFIVSKLNNLV